MENTEHLTGPHKFEMESWISCAPFEKLLNMKIVEASAGRATLTMPFFVDFAQGGGLMHGGALVSLADTAVVMAIKSIIDPQTHFATVSLETKFLYPVKQGIVTARAKIANQKERILQGQATVYNEEERSVLTFTSTAISMEEHAVKLYSESAETTSDTEAKALYEWLARWEREHLSLLLDIDKALREKIWFDNKFWPF